jgi:hypothetical protein
VRREPVPAISPRLSKSCSERQNLLGSAAPFRQALLPVIDSHYVLGPRNEPFQAGR